METYKEYLRKQKRLAQAQANKKYKAGIIKVGKDTSNTYKKANRVSGRIEKSVGKAKKGISQAYKPSKRLSSSLINIGSGFSGQRPQGRVKEGPGRPRGDFKHRDPFTGKPIPATLYYKRIKEFRRLQEQKARQEDLQAIQQLAKRGIPPEQAKQIVDNRQLQSVGVQQEQTQPGTMTRVVRALFGQPTQTQQPQQIQQQIRQVQQANYPSQAVRPIWRRQNFVRVETDMMGNKKEILSGNDPRNFWN